MPPRPKAYVQRWAFQIAKQLWSLGVDQFVGLILMVLILLYQLKAGLITDKQLHVTELATLAYPYLTLIAIYLLLETFRAPFVLDRQQVEKINQLTTELSKYDGPQLVPSMIVLLSRMSNYPNSTVAHCDVTIFNRGTKHTIVKNWQFSYKLTGETGHHRVLSIPVNLVMDPIQGVQPIGDVIADDTGVSPGGSRLYRHRYNMASSLEDLNTRGAIITLQFEDINDISYTVTADIGIPSQGQDDQQ